MAQGGEILYRDKAKIEGCCNQGQLTSENQSGQSIQRLNQIYEVIRLNISYINVFLLHHLCQKALPKMEADLSKIMLSKHCNYVLICKNIA